MKNIKHRSILLGLALLGTTTLIGFNSPASARPDNKREIKQAKREVKEARRELREERKEARRPTPVRRRVRRGRVVRRPVVRGTHYNSTKVYTLTGVVTNDTSGNDFNFRTYSGQTFRVYCENGEPGALSTGDVVRVRGTIHGGAFHATGVTVVRNH